MDSSSNNKSMLRYTLIAVVLIIVLLLITRMSRPASVATDDMDPTDTIKTMDTQKQLQTEDTVVGTGAEAQTGDTVSMNYVGRLQDGTLFDTNNPEIAKAEGVYNPGREYTSFDFTLGAGQVIAGWDQGIVGMKEGGKRTLTISSDLAYGDNGYPPVIPAKATLVFDVELIKVIGK